MLSLHNITYHYPDKRSDFSISMDGLVFQSSLITCILGKNGSGKSTLLNIIGGHLQPDVGKVLLNGKDITIARADQRPTSTVFQQLGLFPHLSVRGNIEIAIEPNTLFKKSAATKEKAQNILKEFDLAEISGRLPDQLSIGQQQRVAIARALSSCPQVLLLDEPTSALDFISISNLKSMLCILKTKRTVPVIIIVSHDLHFVMSIADNIKFIEEGKLLFDGIPATFQTTRFYIN